MKRALVISGGGAFGSFAVGVIETLMKETGKTYDVSLGTSTGALISPFTKTLSDLTIAKQVYLNAEQSTVFKSSPFKISGYEEDGIKFFTSAWNILRRKKAIGDSSNLRGSIKEALTPKHFEELKSSKMDIGCVVTNLTRGKREYKFLKDCDYDEWVEWLMASAAVPVLMNPIKMNDEWYVDGGVTEKAAIDKAISMGADEIDVVVIKESNAITQTSKISNVFNIISSSVRLMLNQISEYNIDVAELRSLKKDIKVNYVYPDELYGSVLIFHPYPMKVNYEHGLIKTQQLLEKGLIS